MMTQIYRGRHFTHHPAGMQAVLGDIGYFVALFHFG
jgi:hypothetical protein